VTRAAQGSRWRLPWRKAFFHRLHSLSGFGDRITDVWAAVTVARLHATDARVAVYWHRHPDGIQLPSFKRNYEIDLFSINACTPVTRAPWRSFRFPREDLGFSDSDRIDRCLIQLPSGARQIVLRSGREWGNSCPDRLHSELLYYGLNPELDLGQVVDTYRAVAADTLPSPAVVEGIPADIESRVGIHARLTDKIQPDDKSEVTFEMLATTWRSIESRGMRYIEHAVEQGERFFICSDDLEYRAALMERIRAMGGDAVCADLPDRHVKRAGYPALVDFFSLTRCARIIQMTKYSTYSIAAAISGGLPLVNFFDNESGVGNRLDIWRSVLTEVHCRPRAQMALADHSSEKGSIPSDDTHIR